MLLYIFSFKCQCIDFWLEIVIFQISLFLMSAKMEEKQEKKISKKQRIIAWIFAFIVLLIAVNSWKNAVDSWKKSIVGSSSETYVSAETQKMRNVVQSRIDTITELFPNEQSEFIKAECKDDCKEADLNIYYSETPNIEWIKDTVDFIARGQSVNLSNELADENLSDQARVYIYVNDVNIYRCSAYKKSIWACKDLR